VELKGVGRMEIAAIFNEYRWIILPCGLIIALVVLIISIGWDFDKDN